MLNSVILKVSSDVLDMYDTRTFGPLLKEMQGGTR